MINFLCPKIFQIKHPKALGRIYFSTSNLHLRPLDPKNKIKDFDWVTQFGLCLKIGFAQKRPSFDVAGRKLTSLGCVGCRTTSSICSFGCPLGSIPEIIQVQDFEMQYFQSFVQNGHDRDRRERSRMSPLIFRHVFQWMACWKRSRRSLTHDN